MKLGLFFILFYIAQGALNLGLEAVAALEE